MAGSIRDPGWWQPHLPQLRREFAELTMDILIAGGDAGAGAIRAGSVLVDWDVFNEDALAWLDMYLGGAPIPGLTSEGAYAWAFMLNDTTRRGVVREIDRWVRSGAPLPELEQRLGSFFDAKRAHRVAVTEVTRIYAAGNVTAWKAAGVVSGKRWRTAVDENVCPICAKLNGKFVELDRGWEFNEAMLAADPALKRALGAPLTVVVPPAHVMCILPGNEVVIPGRLSAAAQSFYDGKAIEITVRSGRVLTVTENHPILTPAGYVAAKFLNKGGYVISTTNADGIAAAVNPDNDYVPAAIEKVFSALKEAPGVVARTMPATAEDFHSDGRRVNGNIDIVFIDRSLQRDGEAAICEHLRQVSLSSNSMALHPLLSFGDLDFAGMRNRHAANRVMGRSDLLPFLFGGHLRPFEEFGFGSAARLNPGRLQTAADSPAVDPQTIRDSLFGFTGKVMGNNRFDVQINPKTLTGFENARLAHDASDNFRRHAFFARQFVERFAGLVTPDEIVSIREFGFSGHVYDLQVDDYELYITDGIITSNCRCWLQPVVFEALTDEERAAGGYNPTPLRG
ncbi:protein of unknown function (plasmid) [Candidatus Promineifilum breve]|jgi:SPP1 gp7 family putative phage head morphogenesis protein|uniref:Hint domain-containing protein n=1 Tax=Candidatus Promineifilum breve TaxID=1806508 RepID=A0A160T7H5_9CHLR|nr:phage minor head protein [Candidatus Promineifilum breve]CUS06441.1 protein of unknown function [Candidatus Promineifilum breve]